MTTGFFAMKWIPLRNRPARNQMNPTVVPSSVPKVSTSFEFREICRYRPATRMMTLEPATTSPFIVFETVVASELEAAQAARIGCVLSM